MEIERKYLIKALPDNLESYRCLRLEQAYLCTDPVVRVRREDNEFYMTYKGSGMIAREEYNLPLNETSYQHLLEKHDGNIISKRRYLIPLEHPVFSPGFIPSPNLQLTIELDVFEAPFAPLVIAEIEFPDIETANALVMPDWFSQDVSNQKEYHNSYLSKMKL